MANDLYGHNSNSKSNTNPRLGSLSSYYTEPYTPPSLLTPSSYGLYLPSALTNRYLPGDRNVSAASAAYTPFPTPSTIDLIASKRSSQAFYEKSVLGSHDTLGQSEALLSLNLSAKRPKYESMGSLSVYPQRSGEKHCVHYMQTRTCKFGDTCKFDHPIWVPESGNPNWKEAPQSTAQPLTFPERPGEPDCPYFLKTSNCKYGDNCKFNHPKETVVSLVTSEYTDASVLPERPSEAPCPFYMKTGLCKFAANCKFNHPKVTNVSAIGKDTGMGEQHVSPKTVVAVKDMNTVQQPVAASALQYNFQGLPIRVGEVDCPYYMKTGSCNYGAACRYSHPNRNESYPAAMSHSALTFPAFNLNHGLVNPATSLFQSLDARLAPSMFGMGPVIYPQRPGEAECDFYMKTGECKYVERCRFHHPIDRSSPNAIKLTPAGLPRREGAEHCAFYMKTSTCKFGPQCKYDHPPPGEVIGLTLAQETASTSTNATTITTTV